MDRLGEALAGAVGPGDCLFLEGPMGAGKSHLARAIIRGLLGSPQAEVPSPTYTLVNAYSADGVEILHGDLYRLADSDEIAELGLDDADGRAVILIEWADRWSNPPLRRVIISIAVNTDNPTRVVTVDFHGGGWCKLRSALQGFA